MNTTKRYQITYILEGEIPKQKRTIYKFGTNLEDLVKSFKEYITEPCRILEIVVEDDE